MSSSGRLGPFDFRAWFAQPPSAPDAYSRALIFLERGRPAEALRELEVALAQDPDGPARARIHNKRGVALIALGEREAAIEAFCTALDCSETAAPAPALVSLGNLFLDSGHPRDAVDYYRAALRADAGYALAQANLAAALRALGDRAGSVRALRAAARLEGRRGPGRA
jgi:tetratricopeptide (TPR) repeat protein